MMRFAYLGSLCVVLGLANCEPSASLGGELLDGSRAADATASTKDDAGSMADAASTRADSPTEPFTCDGGKECPAGSACSLPGGKSGTCCSDVCVDTATDPSNCGSCGNVLPVGASCDVTQVAGAFAFYASCESAPADVTCALSRNSTCCGGQCVATDAYANDSNNCGSCGAACPVGTACSQGECGGINTCASPVTCAPGYTSLGGCFCYLEGSSCAPTTEGVPCALPTDVSGTPAGTCCGSSCVDLLDSSSCGACGHACAADELCMYPGVCQTGAVCTLATQLFPCLLSPGNAGVCCDSRCVDLNSDSSNCNYCGGICPSPTTCVAGLCDIGATTGQCGDATQPDYFTCPSGTHCDSTSFICAATACTRAGEAACGDTNSGAACCGAGDAGCPDLQKDPNNCGLCGVVCPSGVCTEGSCFPTPLCSGCSIEGGCPTGTVCASSYCVAPEKTACINDNDVGGPLCATPQGELGVCCSPHHGFAGQVPCVDPLTDPNNCGGCGVVCASCVNGKCTGDAGL